MDVAFDVCEKQKILGFRFFVPLTLNGEVH
jgi:hypothetical protein